MNNCECYSEAEGAIIYTEDCPIHKQSSPEVIYPHQWGGQLDCDSCYYCGLARDSKVHKTVPEEETMVPRCNTTVEVKSANFDKFASLIGNQFKHGGDKYRLPGFPDREATDVISSVFGGESEFDWILGTMMKYLFRFKNFEREKDLLKVATYCYILWLKQGNHLKDAHDEDVKK